MMAWWAENHAKFVDCLTTIKLDKELWVNFNTSVKLRVTQRACTLRRRKKKKKFIHQTINIVNNAIE